MQLSPNVVPHILKLIEGAKAILERLPADVELLDFESRLEAELRNLPPNLSTANIPPFDFRLSHYLVYADRTALQYQSAPLSDTTFLAVAHAADIYHAAHEPNPVERVTQLLADFPVEGYRADRTPLDIDHPRQPWFAIGEYVQHANQPGAMGFVEKATRNDGSTTVRFLNVNGVSSETTWYPACDLSRPSCSDLAAFESERDSFQPASAVLEDDRRDPFLTDDEQLTLRNRLIDILNTVGVRNTVLSIANILDIYDLRTSNKIPTLHQDLIALAKKNARQPSILDNEDIF